MATADKAKAREQIGDLVARFEALSHAQKRAQKEEATKQGFILRLFQALGWDTTDSVNEVVPEEDASSGSVDYAFKLRGVNRFFLEAKRPREDLDKWALKSISYALNRGVDWLVLTNFQELRIYYALGHSDNHEHLIWKRLDCQDFEKDFDVLWLLSKDSFETGLIAEAARKEARLPRRVTVEETLFRQFQAWRGRLLEQLLGWHNEKHPRPLSIDEAEEIILRLYNRLVFIRSCEDRDIEGRRLWNALQDVGQPGRTAKPARPVPQLSFLPPTPQGPFLHLLRQVFDYYRGIYDSDLFGATANDRHLLDDPDVHLDDGTLEEIVRGLYDVPGRYAQYDFRHISADAMGRVYEMYLGSVPKVAKELKERQLSFERAGGPVNEPIELEARQERRKAQGIYFTPDWVVEYIVGQTVGRALNEFPFAQAQQLRVLDPACGSGSFLVRAYEEILLWYARNITVPKNVRALDWNQRVTFLIKHMHGVDLDPQALEIARLRLMLTALAGKNALPLLRDNIKRGNSLISGGEPELKPFFGDAWRDKRPLNWAQEFPPDGLFDVVIGNPPYVRIQTLPRDEADYFRKNYQSAHGSFDLYVMFIEQGLRLLKPGGRLGFITSGKFLKAEYGKKLQQMLLKEATVEHVVDLSALQVFGDATTYPVIVILRKGAGATALSYTPVPESAAVNGAAPPLDTLPQTAVPQAAITQGVWPPAAGDRKTLMQRMEARSDRLKALASNVFTGLQTSADVVYAVEKRNRQSNRGLLAFSRSLDKSVSLEAGILKPLLSGKHIDRYVTLPTNQLLLFPYSVTDGKAELIPANTFERDYPLTWDYLLTNKKTLEDRENGKMRHERWYAYVYPKSLALHDLPKIAIPRLVHRLQAFYDAEGEFYLDNVDVGGLILRDATDANYKFVLGLLNSCLLDWYFQQRAAPFRGGFRSANRQFLEPLPIRTLDLTKPKEKAQHNRIVALVEEMLALQQRRRHPAAPLTAADQEELDRRIVQHDRAIDDAVYDLYGLTADERRIVEEAVAAPATGASAGRPRRRTRAS